MALYRFCVPNTNPDLVALTSRGQAPIIYWIDRWPDRPIPVASMDVLRNAVGEPLCWPVLDKLTGLVSCSDGRVFESVSMYEESINV
jgi:hypothetical protein